ncbi:MAG TPA: hypothetical protein VFF47_06950 [Nitrospirota bacterium]|nr:hypothetical protein [Nitrospirota bacterium]
MKHSCWVKRSPMHAARSHFAVASCKEKIYVFGGGGAGFTSLCSTEIYCPETDVWSKGKDMPTVRSGTVAAVLSDKIYVMGGGLKLPDGRFQFFRTVEIYDPENDTWTRGPDMLMPHDYPASVVYNNHIYVIGGHHPDATNGGPMTDPGFSFCEVFSLEEEAWHEIAPMPEPRFAHSSAVINNKIVVMGGAGLREEGFRNFDLMESYDPVSNKWSDTGIRLPWPAAGSGALAHNNKLFIIGGKSDNNIENRAACLEPGINTWKELEPLKEGRIVMGVVSIGDTIYLLGGRGPDGKIPIAEVCSLTLL